MRKPKKPEHITQEDWDAVDIPELTDEDFAKMRPAREAAPDLVEMQRRRGRPPVAEPKVPVQIRLSADVVAHFRATGPGWQTRIDETLRKALAREDRAGTRALAAAKRVPAKGPRKKRA
mgnify:CR=1 FL=1